MADTDDEPEDPAENEGEKREPVAEKRKGSLLGLIVVIVGLTILAAGLGGFLGMQTASTIEQTVADRDKAKPADQPLRSTKYGGDMVLQPVAAVVTNLADPSDVWIRLETAFVFPTGEIKNPEVTAAEIREDIVAYTRTIKLAQLEGPSALQHLREDLNERVSVRTNGQVNELIIESLIVQ